MANDNCTNSYEEIRRQRVLDNKKRFEDLGISNISKNLSVLTKSEKKPDQKSEPRRIRQKPNDAYMLEPRRSSRARNPVPTYRDEIDIELPSSRIRSSKFSSSWASYLARPLEEVKTASYEERTQAIKCAEKLMSNLQSGNPAFVKSMVRSHVYSCFWLGLPSRFCEDHLPKSTVDMLLVNEEGSEYEAIFISKRTGFSGGWRAFALDHKLDDGDALVFELAEPTKFKVYIIRASHCSSVEDDKGESEAKETSKSAKRQSKKTLNKENDSSGAEKRAREAEETPKKVMKKRTKSLDNGEREAEETPKSVARKTKKSISDPKVSTIAMEEITPVVSATRRSGRRK